MCVHDSLPAEVCICAIERSRQRQFPVSPVLLGAMAEVQKTEEYLSVRFRTLQGQERTLTFPRSVSLGAFFCCKHRYNKHQERKTERDGKQIMTGEMQKELCMAFSKHPAAVVVSWVRYERGSVFVVLRNLLRA